MMRISTLFLLVCSSFLLLYETSAFAPVLTQKNRVRLSHQLHVTQESHQQYDQGHVATEDTLTHHEQAPTLYDILHAPPDATRAELKRHYVMLARATHPDSHVSRRNSTLVDTTTEFSEIAAAWRILGDEKQRKKYDRSLMAERFSGDVEYLATEFGKTVAPAARHVVEQWAMPFMERAAAATIVSFAVAAEDLEDSKDLGHAVEAAIKAGHHANQMMDRNSLLEKSKELEESSSKEAERARRIKARLSALIDKRLHMALQTRDATLSSAEALKILDSLNTADTLSLVDRARRKHRVVDDIEALEQAETEYYETFDQHSSAEEAVNMIERSLLQAQEDTVVAIEAQDEARKVLEEAQKRVIATRDVLYDICKEYESSKAHHKRTTADLGKCVAALEKRQEKVRQVLSQKAEETRRKRQASDEYVEEEQDETQGGLTEIEELRKQEQQLTIESARFEAMAKQFLARAQKMKQRAEELKENE